MANHRLGTMIRSTTGHSDGSQRSRVPEEDE